MKNQKVQLPIFPLPESIIFPGVSVPLHVFEARYKQMLKMIVDTGKDLAISYAPELQPNRFFPHMICGAGPVRVLQTEETGESDILVLGSYRVRFEKYIQEVPFLIGEGEIMPLKREMPEQTEQELLTQIRDMLINWVFARVDDARRPIQFFKSVSDLEPLCNFVIYYFLNEMDKKQKLLEEDELEVKAQMVWQLLKDQDTAGFSEIPDVPLIFPRDDDGGEEGPIN